MRRRQFLGAAAAAAGLRPLCANDAPRRKGTVVKLFKSPEGHPNGLEATAEGLWIGEQVSDRAHLADWQGTVLKTVETESSNTSGIAYGAGHLWMAANGKALWRAKRATDATTGAVVKVDPATGQTEARYEIPGGGGVSDSSLPRARCGSRRYVWRSCLRWIRRTSGSSTKYLCT